MGKYIELVAKNKLVSCLLLITICAALTYCNSCSRINEGLGLPDDHIGEALLEEHIEDAIEQATGVRPEIDLTP